MKSKHWIVILSAIVLLSAAASVPLFLPSAPSRQAQIISNGELIRTVSLAVDQTLTVPCPDGFNTVTVKDGKIAVTEADCPDQYCVRHGFCDSGVQIVCLPHGLVITFLDDEGIDGAIG